MTASSHTKEAPPEQTTCSYWWGPLEKKAGCGGNTAHRSVNELQLPPPLNNLWRMVISGEETLGGFAEPSVEGIANELH